MQETPLYLPDAVEALALAELVFGLPRALFGLLEAAHGVGLVAVAEEDVAQVVVGAVKVLQQLPFPLTERQPAVTLRRFLLRVKTRRRSTRSLLCDEDAPADEFAAALGLAEVIADQAQVEKQTRLHLVDLPRRHGPCRDRKWENSRLENNNNNTWLDFISGD